MGTRPVPLSPRGAVMLGLAVMACGVAPILAALQIIDLDLSPGTPAWVGGAAGAIFLLAGAALVNAYAFGGGERFETAAPPLVRAVQHALGFALCATFAAVFGWIAFGPGERRFSGSLGLPFFDATGKGNELAGRALFGLVAVLSGVMAVAGALLHVRKKKK